MGPQRLLILALLGYAAWSLLRSLIQEKIRDELRQQEQDSRKEESRVKDVLEEDPVCHTLIPRHQAVRLRQDGKTYYFCSESCCDIFTNRQEGSSE